MSASGGVPENEKSTLKTSSKSMLTINEAHDATYSYIVAMRLIDAAFEQTKLENPKIKLDEKLEAYMQHIKNIISAGMKWLEAISLPKTLHMNAEEQKKYFLQCYENDEFKNFVDHHIAISSFYLNEEGNPLVSLTKSTSEDSMHFSRQLTENLNKITHSGETINSYAIRPIQIIPKYELLCREFKRHSEKEHPDMPADFILKTENYVKEHILKMNNIEKQKEYILDKKLVQKGDYTEELSLLYFETSNKKNEAKILLKQAEIELKKRDEVTPATNFDQINQSLNNILKNANRLYEGVTFQRFEALVRAPFKHVTIEKIPDAINEFFDKKYIPLKELSVAYKNPREITDEIKKLNSHLTLLTLRYIQHKINLLEIHEKSHFIQKLSDILNNSQKTSEEKAAAILATAKERKSHSGLLGMFKLTDRAKEKDALCKFIINSVGKLDLPTVDAEKTLKAGRQSTMRPR